MKSIVGSKIQTEEVSASELISLIPDSLIDDLASSLSVDKWVKKLKGKPLFKLLLFSILSSERLSLRIMEDNFKDPMFHALAPALDIEKLGYTGIRDRLINVKSDFFAKLYDRVYERVFEQYSKKSLLGYNIKRYDSTMIATFSHLLEGMRVGNTSKNKQQVKLTTEFTNDFLIKMDFYDTQEFLSEEIALKTTISNSTTGSKTCSKNTSKEPKDSKEKQKDIHVFDKGLKARKTLELFDVENTLFVTRLNGTPRYEVIRPFLEPISDDESLDNEELEFVQDTWVKLYKSGYQLTDREFRLIQFNIKKPKKVKGKNGEIKEEIKTLYFITNVTTISAADIACIYKMRWDIEVLFRFLKQEMNLTHFVCNDHNAIKVMLYSTLIAAMLILIYKKRNNIKSYKKAKNRFFKELLYDILDNILDNPELTVQFRKNIKNFKKNRDLDFSEHP